MTSKLKCSQLAPFTGKHSGPYLFCSLVQAAHNDLLISVHTLLYAIKTCLKFIMQWSTFTRWTMYMDCAEVQKTMPV
ncbi:unnamed protein product [Urochloa humidicola]